MARVAKRRPARKAEEPLKTPSKRRITGGQKNSHDDIYDVPDDNDNDDDEGSDGQAVGADTPSRKRGGGRPRKAPGLEDEPFVRGPAETPSKRCRTTAFTTPKKAAGESTPIRRTLADRSARRKSTRALINRIVAGGDDEDEDEEEGALAAIFGGGEEEEEEEEEEPEEGEEPEEPEEGEEGEEGEEDEEEEAEQEKEGEAEEDKGGEEQAAATPRRRGRPKSRAEKDHLDGTAADASSATPLPVKRGPGRPRKDRTAAARAPSPPRDLPAHEHYFFQNSSNSNTQAARTKTSNNTLASLRLLTHEEYFALRHQGREAQHPPHQQEIQFLEDLHAQSFGQWAFELSQGFGVCLYGYGSKRRLLRAFARRVVLDSRRQRRQGDHQRDQLAVSEAKVVMVEVPSGSSASATSVTASTSVLRDILAAVAAAVDVDTRLPAAITAAEKTLLSLLDDAASPTSSPITLVVDAIDAPPLRRPAAQATLARIAAHPRVRLLCAADTPGCALLWDGALRAALNIVFHDATTFRPFFGPSSASASAAASSTVVDDVHALLGRRVRRVGGKDGAAFVLRSLPENARSLFQLLVAEALAASEDGAGGGAGSRRRRADVDASDSEDDGGDHDAPESAALEYRMLYNRAMEEFICSSEMAFRTLLKEFHDHQMVTSRKDAFGTEMLSLPFRRDELEALLEDLVA